MPQVAKDGGQKSPEPYNIGKEHEVIQITWGQSEDTLAEWSGLFGLSLSKREALQDTKWLNDSILF